MLTIIAAIFVFGLLIFVHEFGHFITAKWSGMRVEEFSIGMGPRLFKFRKGETQYSLSLLPIGGYVRVTGEMDEEFDDGVLAPDDPRRYGNRPVWQRMIFAGAGSFMNFVTAIVLFAIIFLSIGIPVVEPNADTVISGVVESGPAYEAGLKAGDKVLVVNEQEVNTWNELVAQINASEGQKIDVLVDRNGKKEQLSIVPIEDPQAGDYKIGIQKQAHRMQEVGLFESIKLGAIETANLTKSMLVVVGDLITGQQKISGDQGLVGPVGIVQIIGDSAQGGIYNILYLAALLSVNLGLLNILPVPALDGSRLVFLAIEGVRGKPIDPRKENMVHMIGFALLMVLILFVTFQDITRLFS